MFTIIAFFLLIYLIDRFIYKKIIWPLDELEQYQRDNLLYKDLYVKMQEENEQLWRGLRKELGPLYEGPRAGLSLKAPCISGWGYVNPAQVIGILKYQMPYIIALIDMDGENYKFRDELLLAGEKGGRQAVARLYSELEIYLGSMGLNPEDLVIIVRVYADLQALGQCVKDKHDSQDLGSFVHGFNDEESTFDLVDQGPSVKENVRKVERLWGFHNEDLNCKQILIGAWDLPNRAIERFAKKERLGAKVTFVKGTVERDWKGLKTVELSGVFESEAGQVEGKVTDQGPAEAEVTVTQDVES
ncbi:MAG: hypothetical protein Q9174_001520 [Haloplaca sp. 1 TL-2023]